MAAKASFDDIYDLPDPRAYFRRLSTHDYQIPAQARAIFSLLTGMVRARTGDDRSCVLDLCCSYGINAALLNHDVTLAELYARYRSAELAPLTSEELAAADREFYARRRSSAVPVVGLDAAINAVGYAQGVGLLDVGISENLETQGPSDELQGHLATVGLITVTGGIGYITGATFDRILGSVSSEEPPWVAAFVLRWVDMAPIGAVLERYGLALEVLEGRTFRQRRFVNDDEREHAVAHLRRLGLDPNGVESDGYHHAVLYLARPQQEAPATPLDELLAPAL